MTDSKMQAKPDYLKPIFENFPKELTTLNQWVVWRAELKYDKEGNLEIDKNGNPKWSKEPFNSLTGRWAKSNTPATWSSFEDARKAYQTGNYDGVGFVLTAGDPIVGVDLDHILTQEKKIEDKAKAIIDTMQTYTEKSPSGDGVRLFATGKLPPSGRKKGNYELYESGRYLTLTGHRMNELGIESRQSEIEEVHNIIFGKSQESIPNLPSVSVNPTDLSDSDLWNKMFIAKNGNAIRDLYQGNTAGYESHSDADMALCGHLAYWTGRDAVKMDSMFRESGLIRDKWDKKHYANNQTYGQHTIEKAIANCQQTYDPEYRKTSYQNQTQESKEPPVEIPCDFENDLLWGTELYKDYPFWDENFRIIKEIFKTDRERYQSLKANLKKISGFSSTELEKTIREHFKQVKEQERKEKREQVRKKREDFPKIPNAFWYEDYDRYGNLVLKIDNDNLYNILKSHGFCHIELDKKLILCRIKDNVCYEIDNDDLRKFVYFIIEGLPEKITVYKTKKDLRKVFARGIKSYIFDNLNSFYFDRQMPEFIRDSNDLSYFFFKNGYVKIDKDSVSLEKYETLPGLIWQSQIIDHDFKHDIDFDFSFSQFIQKVCTDKRTSKVDVPRHTALKETIGYLLHDHVTGYNNKAVVFSESSLDDDPQGRTGKGLIVQSIGKLRKKTTIDGKNFFFDSQFAFQNMSLDTKVLFFDDVKKFFDFKRLYSAITEGISFEKKNRDRVNLSPEQSPKIVISTNYAIQGNSESDKGRRIDMELLCYFSSSYTPEHEFREVFFESWDNEKWNKFYNFMFFCVQKWLTTKQITDYNSETKELKRIIIETSYDFVDFADNLPLNTEVVIKDVYADFVQLYQLTDKDCNPKKFGIWLAKYAKYMGYELEKLRNSKTRFFKFKTSDPEPDPPKSEPEKESAKVDPVSDSESVYKSEIPEKCLSCKQRNGERCRGWGNVTCEDALTVGCKGKLFKEKVN